MTITIVVIISFTLAVLLMTNYIKEYNETVDLKDEYMDKCIKLTRDCKELEDYNEELKDLRRQDLRNNTIIVNKNTEMTKLLNEIADRAVTAPVDSEKIVLAKIRELTHDYQSKVSSK